MTKFNIPLYSRFQQIQYAKNLKTPQCLKLNVEHDKILLDDRCGSSPKKNQRRESAEVGRRGAEIPVCVWRNIPRRVGEISQQVGSTPQIRGIEVKRPSLPCPIKVLILIHIADLLPGSTRNSAAPRVRLKHDLVSHVFDVNLQNSWLGGRGSYTQRRQHGVLVKIGLNSV